ncbi:hypothetical protein CIB84_008256 [Bambusicola thoracicus]|uniref:PHF7/G2E3-like PHD zinc finger domain-containing protein n=1 Tax=Bambusicola thoracicus TaxID=9083 RepID=A0A2P4SV48_BAMTH|nr:hypothetical protein CIB84_008256 [Bambusicola thoracicus]
MEHQSRAGCSLPWLSPSSQPQPVCFPRPWRLLLCSSCAAEGIHWACSFWATHTRCDTWECNSCAGAGTASQANSDLAICSTSGQMALGPANNFSQPGNVSPGPNSQAAMGPSCSSQLPELSVQPRVPAAEQRTTRSTSSEERDTSQQHRGRGGRRQAPAAGMRSPRSSLAAAPRKRPRQRGPSQTRSRSPLQGQGSGSQSRPRRHYGGSHTKVRGAQSSTRTSAAPAPSRSSRPSLLPARRRQSRQRGQARTRSRSPVGCRASTSRRQRGPARARSRSRGPARAQSHSLIQHQRRCPHSRVPSPPDGCAPKQQSK